LDPKVAKNIIAMAFVIFYLFKKCKL